MCEGAGDDPAEGSAVRVGAGVVVLALAALAVPGGLVCAADVHRDDRPGARGARVTTRLREACAGAVAENRSVDEVARRIGCRGRRCSRRWTLGRPSGWASRRRPASWVWTRPGSARPVGCVRRALEGGG
jgi:hypothetical protein